MKNLIKFRTDSAINIDRIAGILDENGIPSMIKDQNAAGNIAGFGTIDNSVEIFIEKEHLQEARRIIDNVS